MSEFSVVMRKIGKLCEDRLSECNGCPIERMCPSTNFLDRFTKPGRAEALEKTLEALDETGGEITEDIAIVNLNETIERLVRAVVENQVEASIDIEPKQCEIRLEPWRPMRMQCPYGRNEEG